MLKSGFATSEFILAVIVIAAASALLFLGKIDAEAWKWAVGFVGGGYAISRGLAKMNPPKNDS